MAEDNLKNEEKIKQALFAAFGYNSEKTDKFYNDLKDVRKVDCLCEIIYELGKRKRENENLRITTDMIRDKFFGIYKTIAESKKCVFCKGAGHIAAVHNYETDALVKNDIEPFSSNNLVVVYIECSCEITEKRTKGEYEDRNKRYRRMQKYGFSKTDRAENFVRECRYLYEEGNPEKFLSQKCQVV